MKRVLLYVLVFAFALGIPLRASNKHDDSSLLAANVREPIIKLASEHTDIGIKAAAAEYLEMFRTNDDYEMLGFTREQFYGMQIGNPFVVYQFDINGRVLSDTTGTVVYNCPMVYMGKIIGVVAVYYDEKTGKCNFAAHRETIYERIALGTVDTSKNLIVGNMDSTLFVTDGKNVDILGIIGQRASNKVDKHYIEKLCTTFENNVGNTFVAANDVSNSPMPQVSVNGADDLARNVIEAILYVPYVAQGQGICGCASWASVLNYRFNDEYDAETLRQAMVTAGYIDELEDPIPSMADYRDFANEMHPGAGCVGLSSPPSFSVVENAIINERPIMGSWWRYDNTQSRDNGGSDSTAKIYHTINIIGYRKIVEGYYNYYVVNPWFDYVAMIYVANSSNVVCDDTMVFPEGWSSRVWHLSQVVY